MTSQRILRLYFNTRRCLQISIRWPPIRDNTTTHSRRSYLKCLLPHQQRHRPIRFQNLVTIGHETNWHALVS